MSRTFLYTAQGFDTGGQWEGGQAGFINLCKAGQFTPLVHIAETPKAVIDTLKGASLEVWGWEDLEHDPLGPEGWKGVHGIVPQIESPTQRDLAADALRGWSGPNGICTTYFGLDDLTHAKWNAFLSRAGKTPGFVAAECYANDGHANIDAMMFQGTQYGIPAALLRPIFGVYRSEFPTDYKWSTPSRSFDIYIAESLSDAAHESAWIAAWRTYWHLTAPGGTLLHSEWATSYSATDDGLSRMLLWMEANKSVLRANAGASLARAVALS